MKGKYYPAIFERCNGAYRVKLPDFPECEISGNTFDETVEHAVSAIGQVLGSRIYSKEENEASEPASIAVRPGSFLVMIHFDPRDYLAKHGGRSVQRAVTLPAWLDQLARDNHINVSRVLQRALRDELGVDLT